MSKKARAIIIVGDSYTGKSTLSNNLKNTYPDIFMESISYTSRKPKMNEKNHIDYHFVDKSYFLDNKDSFLEYAIYNGEYYGTSIGSIEEAYKEDKVVILVLEREGAKKLHTLSSTPSGIPMETDILLLDIERASIRRAFEEKLNEGKFSLMEKNVLIENFEERISRRSNSDKKMRELASIIREEYLPKNYFKDVLTLLPADKQDIILAEKNKLIEKEKVMQKIYMELIDELKDIIPSNIGIKKLFKDKMIPKYIVEKIASPYGLGTEELLDYAYAARKFPLYYISSDMISGERCRISNFSLVKDVLEETINETKGCTTESLFETVVGVHTENGYKPISLNQIEGLTLDDLDFSQEVIHEIESNDTLLEIKAHNAEKRALNSSENNTPQQGI